MLVNYRFGDVGALYLTGLVLGQNYNLAVNYMIDLKGQVITVDDEIDPAPENVLDQLSQQVNLFNCKS